MKKLFTSIVLACLVSMVFIQWPAMGKVEYKTMPSKILNQDREYAIYLPKNYASNPEKSYPVPYLLHGAGSHKDWPEQGRLAAVANQLIDTNDAANMIVYTLLCLSFPIVSENKFLKTQPQLKNEDTETTLKIQYDENIKNFSFCSNCNPSDSFCYKAS